jgi:predicted ATP-dependent endonuclease of OLD family
MRIKRFHIRNYKSILDSGEIDLDPAISVLIGKNESGKTCVLKALESFKRDYRYAEDDLCLHSEAKIRLEAGKVKEEDIEIITIWFEVEDKDRERLKEINPRLENLNSLKAKKYFDNSYEIAVPHIDEKRIKTTDFKKISDQMSRLVEIVDEFREKLYNHSQRHAPFSRSRSQYESAIHDLISFGSGKNGDIERIFADVCEKLRNLEGIDYEIKNDTEAFIRRIEPLKNEIRQMHPEKGRMAEDIFNSLPNFVYFSDFERLEDSLPITDYLSHKEKHKTLSNLIELSGLDVERTKDAQDYAMLAQLRSASATITGLVNQSWTQEDVNVNIAVVRDRIVISIVDSVIRRDHPPSIRSHGFQWFLSFYINFMVGSRGEFKNTVLLLDDLGVYLHRSGQRDLVATLERIAKSNQIVFSTHSPFMVDREKLMRIRIISKKEGKGTCIRSPRGRDQ